MGKFQIGSMLLIGIIALQATFGQSATTESVSHNFSWGARGPRDLHLSRQIVTENFKMLRIVSSDYEFKQDPNKFPFKRTITNIVVTDQYTNGNGGTATLKSGGPNTDFAIIHLKSQRNHGYSFVIDIFGQ